MQYENVIWHSEDAPVSVEALLLSCPVLEVVGLQQGSVERACLVQKVYGKPIFLLKYAPRMEFLVHLCTLAEAMGYSKVLKTLELVWKRAAIGKRTSEIGLYRGEAFVDLLGEIEADFQGGRKRSLESPQFLSAFLTSGDYRFMFFPNDIYNAAVGS